MASYLQLIAISRSQRIRIGRGAGNSLVSEINMGDLPVHPQSGNLAYAFYFNINDPWSKKDYQHHSALGALDSIGLDTTHSSDLFAPSGLVASAGTGLTVATTAGVLQSRIFGGKLNVPAYTTLAVAPNTSGSPRVDTLLINPNGSYEVVTGVPAPTNVYEVDTLTPSGTISGGTFTLTFSYNNGQATNTFTTASLAYNATAATVATAVVTAGNLPGTLTGTGGTFATPAAIVLTASGALTGPITGLKLNSSLTGTTPAVAVTRTTSGVQGPVAPTTGGGCAQVATFTVANNATGPSAFSQVIATS
jgi:hypothetical protein